MYSYEVCEIGRESVKSVNASMLASLIKDLVSRSERSHSKSKQTTRRLFIRCREKLEFSPGRRCRKGGGTGGPGGTGGIVGVDDEGFESEDGNEEDSLLGDLSNEDAQSTTSSCCLVEDHVFKSGKPDLGHRGKDPTSLVSIIGSVDSANSSGSSDTDDIDVHSLTPSPIGLPKKSSQTKRPDFLLRSGEYETPNEKKQMKSTTTREEYPISDVIFCHTEPKYPNVIAWVIKKQPFDFGSRLGAKGVETFTKIDNCLEVIVVKCKSDDNLRELCSNYQEYSKRTKLDNYKSIKRKKDVDQKMSVTLTPLTDSKDVKVSLSDMKIANSSLIKASELSILNPKIMTSFRNDLKNSVSLNSLIKPEKTACTKTTLEIKLTGNGGLSQQHQPLQQQSVTKTQSLLNISRTWDPDHVARSGTVLREKNSNSTGDQFNLVQRTDTNGVTHLEVTKAKSNVPDRFSAKSKLRKEIEGVILTDVESYARKEQIRQRTSPDGSLTVEKIYDSPPIRPERRKYRKKTAAPSPPGHTQPRDLKPGNSSQFGSARMDKPKNSFFLAPQNGENRLKKDPQMLGGPLIDVQSWRNQSSRDMAPGNWKSDPRGRLLTKFDEKHTDKRRSTSAGRHPSTKKAPMAYRYIYVTNDYRDTPSMKRGLPSKIREVGGNLTNTIQNLRRRNSFDDIITYNNHVSMNNMTKSNLKSVIKKNKKINDKYCEPKKVTFSAFATVQVVD